MESKNIFQKISDFFSTPKELTDEVKAVVDANQKATDSGLPQEVKVDSQKFVISDDGAGRQATPA